MPPGIDEPSLPALPHALMPHHIRQRQRSVSHVNVAADGGPHIDLAPPLQPFPASAHPPPPSFAASEAAEAQGFPAGLPIGPPAADPVSIGGGGGGGSHLEIGTSSIQSHTPDHPPPLYTTGQGITTADLPPSYR